MPKLAKTRLIIAHIPVIHRGYLEMFKRYASAQALYVIGQTWIDQLDYKRKDLRSLQPDEVVLLLSNYNRFEAVKLLTEQLLSELDDASNEIILPDEDISHIVGDQIKRAEVTYYPIFLRWDRRAMEQVNKHEPGVKVTKSQKHIKFMQLAQQSAKSSTDIWRRVGSVIVAPDGHLLNQTSNLAEPTPSTPWIEGDPRIHSGVGQELEVSLFTHAEAALIADAAKTGSKLNGATLYVTTFPCPACAKLIARSGIAHVYYKDGYAVLDGRRVLDDYRVGISRVDVSDLAEHPDTWVSYPKRT